MSTAIDIQVATISTKDLPSEQALTRWLSTAIIGSKTEKKDIEVSIRIVDKEESQSLNHQYRQKDKPTNVLSFPAEFPEGVDIPFIGDLIICAPVVEEEAHEQNKPLIAHWAHMVIHGTLHLLGYDHIEQDDADIMEGLETKLLQSLGYPCPYSTENN